MDNINFNDLWKKQTVSQPNIEDLKNRLKEFKKAALKTMWKVNILLSLTSVFIVFIWIYFQPQFISTKIGIVLTILAMVMYVILYNRLSEHYRNIDTDQSNQEYLQKLILIKRKQQFMQTKGITWYFLLLIAGICLYMYEYASRMNIEFAILTYAITLLWIGFNWFYLRPKQIKKQQQKINSLIEKFEEVDRQLEI
ncbi:hypothetical protein [Flavobacterium olei]|uniref:hypothetical protein n=1 Tax=Flavobacterium olei TaxID=1886782 RepID=UPI0032197689